jgi:hypothetical protein
MAIRIYVLISATVKTEFEEGMFKAGFIPELTVTRGRFELDDLLLSKMWTVRGRRDVRSMVESAG